ncbi:MAG TPA: response regulator transcription factor [Pseudomonadota bacterium]|nr:response regulator transcription factor [Pseudomonadota bacterium]
MIPKSAVPPTPQTALIVEDLPDAQEWLARALQASFPGIAIARADTLHAARQTLSHPPAPQLVLIDLGLPDGSGIELIAELSRDSPATQCVVVSIYDDNAHLFPALRAGAQGYLLKDQPQKQIVELLQGITAGRPPLSPAIARKLLSFFQGATPPQSEALTRRETEVLTLIAKGITQAEAARMLGLSTHTVCGHVKEIYRKLNVSSRAEAALTAQRLGLIS